MKSDLVHYEHNMLEYVQLLNPHSLRPHPLNERLYGREDNSALRASIEAGGILNPLIVTRELTIISGHRRHAIALELDLPTIPVVISPLADDREIEEAIIRANIARDKTNYQLAREYQRLKPILAELARKRQVAGKSQDFDLPPNLAEGQKMAKGETRELAAEMLGLKRSSAEKALKAIQAIDHAEQAGARAEARSIIESLNKSF